MIAIGRVLTGNMPEHVDTSDFSCGTCALSIFKRRGSGSSSIDHQEVKPWVAADPEDIPDVGWRDGKGILGGWDCLVNGDCSHLKGGEERTW